MIRKVTVANFKCFKEQEIALGRLTVLAGLNGTGKSSVMQALLLLRQSGLGNDGRPAHLRWQGRLIDLGSFRDVLYERAEQDVIEIAAAFDPPGGCRVAIRQGGDGKLAAREGFADAPGSSLYRWSMFYVTADRLGPQKALPFLEQGHESNTPLGSKGEHVLWFLEQYGERRVRSGVRLDPSPKNTLMAQTNAWIKLISPGAMLEIDSMRNADLALAGFSFFQPDDVKTRSFRATNVGFGLSYALPVIVALLAAGKDDLVLIENPEAHLHPAGQTHLAELAARSAAAGSQVVMETHSDHVLDGVRLAAHGGSIEADQIVLHYFERDGMRVTVTTPQMGSDGRLDMWPDGFFDQHERNLGRLIGT